MASDSLAELSDCISRAIQEHFAGSESSLLNSLSRPVIRIEAFLQDGDAADARRLLSRSLDLSQAKSPVPQLSPTALTNGLDRVGTNQNGAPIDSSLTLESSSSQVPGLESVLGQTSPSFSDGGPSTRQSGSCSYDDVSDSDESSASAHKATGGLRLARGQSVSETPSDTQRQLQSDHRSFPKRRKIRSDDTHSLQPSSLDKLVVGIWEQIHGSINLDPSSIIEQIRLPISDNGENSMVNRIGPSEIMQESVMRVDDSFSQMNIFCRKVTQASRTCRSIELIVQAYWMEQFDQRIKMLADADPDVSHAKHKKATMMQACKDFEWSEKELRNKMAIWRGYKEVKDAGGWAALVFAGMGLYRFCKYRVGFDKEAMQRLKNLQARFEVAADTLHPNWRRLLTVIGESADRVYQGHPHDWVVSLSGDNPRALRSTYLQWDQYFSFEHVEDSIIDNDAWGCDDPRWIPSSNSARASGKHMCEACGQEQSDDPKINSCYCFSSLYGCGKRNPCSVQVFRTANGRNNGLLACCSFERGTAIGEFTGLITRNLRNLDVMDGSTPVASYQIWQGRQGNYTRFVNHSCKANAQFQRFAWLDTQRIVLVSKGIEAGTEITVDYSDRYWGGLQKKCLCGEPCCRYKIADRESAARQGYQSQ